MRCSICGAKLKKDGDICTNCYKEFQEEEKLNNIQSEKELLKTALDNLIDEIERTQNFVMFLIFYL